MENNQTPIGAGKPSQALMKEQAAVSEHVEDFALSDEFSISLVRSQDAAKARGQKGASRNRALAFLYAVCSADAQLANFEPCSLERIYDFCTIITSVQSLPSFKQLVVECSGSDAKIVTTASLLLGSYLFLCKGACIDDVITKLEPISPFFLAFHDELTVHDCLRALDTARDLNWLNFNACIESESDPDVMLPDNTINISEMAHYASALNGSLLVIVPGELFVCAAPNNLPNSSMWLDSGNSRAFSPCFMADLLAEKGVALILSPIGAPGSLTTSLPIVWSILATCLRQRHRFSVPAAMGWLRMLQL